MSTVMVPLNTPQGIERIPNNQAGLGVFRKLNETLNYSGTIVDMGGTNPYVNQEAPAPATQKFTITFLPMNVTVEVDPERIPYGVTGLPGSILDIALANRIGIDHACGGVCACSTCHCIVREGLETISEMSDAEEDELSFAPGLTPNSRLSCQSVPDGTRNLVVEIPNWNRNAVREGH